MRGDLTMKILDLAEIMSDLLYPRKMEYIQCYSLRA